MTILKEELNLKYDKYYEKADKYKMKNKHLTNKLNDHKAAEVELSKIYQWTKDQWENLQEESAATQKSLEADVEWYQSDRDDKESQLTITKHKLEHLDESHTMMISEFAMDRARYDNQVKDLQEDTEDLRKQIAELLADNNKQQNDNLDLLKKKEDELAATVTDYRLQLADKKKEEKKLNKKLVTAKEELVEN